MELFDSEMGDSESEYDMGSEASNSESDEKISISEPQVKQVKHFRIN